MKYGGLFRGRAGADKEERKTAQQRRQEKEQKIDDMLFDTDVELNLVYERYKVTLQKELIRARAYQKQGIKNQDNYAKIGIAYYSMLMVRRAQERMEGMKSTRELYSCMTQLSNSLSAINHLSGNLGRLDIKSLPSEMKAMEGAAGGSSSDLLKTFSMLQSLEGKLPGMDAKNTGTDQLVSADLIERLIRGENVDQCVSARAGVKEETLEMEKEYFNLQETLQTVPGAQELQGLSEEESIEKIRERLKQLG